MPEQGTQATSSRDKVGFVAGDGSGLIPVHGGYDRFFKKCIEHPAPAIAANVMIGPIKLTNYPFRS